MAQPKEQKKEDDRIPLYSCVCSHNPTICTHSTIHCGVVVQISCKCGRGVHGRTVEQAKALWDVIQLHLHKTTNDLTIPIPI